MKKYIGLIMLLACVFVFAGCRNNTVVKINHPYTQEYIAGQGNIKGNVDIEYYSDISGSFLIGANKDGYAVFKDPEKAFMEFTEEYLKGIDLIREEFDLPALSQENFKQYKKYGWQVTTGTDEQREEAQFVSEFLDIYENSF